MADLSTVIFGLIILFTVYKRLRLAWQSISYSQLGRVLAVLVVQGALFWYVLSMSPESLYDREIARCVHCTEPINMALVPSTLLGMAIALGTIRFLAQDQSGRAWLLGSITAVVSAIRASALNIPAPHGMSPQTDLSRELYWYFTAFWLATIVICYLAALMHPKDPALSILQAVNVIVEIQRDVVATRQKQRGGRASPSSPAHDADATPQSLDGEAASSHGHSHSNGQCHGHSHAAPQTANF